MFCAQARKVLTKCRHGLLRSSRCKILIATRGTLVTETQIENIKFILINIQNKCWDFLYFFFQTKYLGSKPFLKLINKFFLELLLFLLKFNSKLFSSFPDAVTKPTFAKLFSYILHDLLHLCRVCWMKPMTRRCEMKSERWQGISELSSYQRVFLLFQSQL